MPDETDMLKFCYSILYFLKFMTIQYYYEILPSLKETN